MVRPTNKKVLRPPYWGYPDRPTPKARNDLHNAIELIFDAGEDHPEKVPRLERCLRTLSHKQIGGRAAIHLAVDKILDEEDVNVIGNLYSRVADIERGGLGLPNSVRMGRRRRTQAR
jgi:hypothetical protein